MPFKASRGFECCGCTIFESFHENAAWYKPKQLEEKLKEHLPFTNPAMVMAVLNQTEYESLFPVFEKYGFRVIGDQVKNPSTGNTLWIICKYKVKTEQEKAAEISPKKSIAGIKV